MLYSNEQTTNKAQYIDVKTTTAVYALKPGLQAKLRSDGILEYYVVPGTKKILYKKTAIENLISSGLVK